MHVLIATDGSQTSVDAARRAVVLFDRPDHVTLLTESTLMSKVAAQLANSGCIS